MGDIQKYPVKEIENTWITMSDGCRLAARIWMPENAAQEPVPAVLEYLPYRKRDGTTIRDALTHPYVAAAGYACIRVDMRGNGDSDGLMEDEYTRQEQDDALEVIAWLSGQPWCSGNVGMIGISWGGFNGLQVAARQPAALKAVISMCSTDDRYADDIHYMGGTLLNYNLGWAAVMMAYSSRPCDPEVVGDGWRDIWMNRLENLPFLIEPWLTHQRRDDYWKHGSICENYADVKVPVFLVGGWADGYSNTIFRMLQGLKSPVTALIGPWAHLYPNFAKPGPAVGFLQECIRFWDHWLKDKKNSIMDEPVRTYIQESVPPRAMYDFVPGTWTTQAAWPPAEVSALKLYPGINGLDEAAGSGTFDIDTPQTLGRCGGRWFSFGSKPDLPTDQQAEDKDAVVFETDHLDRDTVICGAPRLKIRLSSDQAFGILCARLSDVQPDGQVTRMSYGLINLTHHASHENPEALEPGRYYDLILQLNETAWRLPAGHKLRLSLSNTYWPMVWPSPGKTVLTVDRAETCLELPVQRAEFSNAKPIPEPENAPALDQTWIRPAKGGWSVQEDMETGRVTTHILDDYGDRVIHTHGLRTAFKGEEAWEILPDDPFSARATLTYETLTARDDWEIKTECVSTMTADDSYFYITATLKALENEEPAFHKSWNLKIKRESV
ncbi:MAG: CocE/NonD family hydrolase [Desulfobacterales bacterium]|nr:CocE/NonD family hydrolase [Desulfobacterales bacterium]